MAHIPQRLFDEVEGHHVWEACTDRAAIDDVERRLGLTLPTDLKEFYRRYKSVKLFDSGYGAAYSFAQPSEIHRTRIDIYGEQRDSDDWGPSNWVTVCDVLDGNFIALDIASGIGTEFNYIDCFHETFAIPGCSAIIATSFVELLSRALYDGPSLYYLRPDFKNYGDAIPITAETASRRIENPEAPKKGWLVHFVHTGKAHNKFFADIDYGGKTLSFNQVRRYIRRTTRFRSP